MSFRLISYINEVTVLFSIFCIRSVTSGLNKYFGKNNYSKKKNKPTLQYFQVCVDFSLLMLFFF